MTFREYCDSEGIVGDEREKFREFVANDEYLGLLEGTDVNKENIDEDALGEMYDEFLAESGDDEEDDEEDKDLD